MQQEEIFDVIIIGGSFSGMSAALSLARSCRKILVIDGGSPANRNSHRSYNLLAHDGDQLEDIRRRALADIEKYDSVTILNDTVESLQQQEKIFQISTVTKKEYRSRRVLFCTGLIDELPDIDGIKACWGKSVVHCPYCHGFEIRDNFVGIIDNGYEALTLASLVRSWNKKVVLFTNGTPTLSEVQMEILKRQDIEIVSKKISKLEHNHGQINQLIFEDGSFIPITHIYISPEGKQHSALPEQSGCELVERGLIKVDDFYQTTVPGIYAAGDCAVSFRAIPVAIASGTKAGAFIHQDLNSEYLQSLI